MSGWDERMEQLRARFRARAAEDRARLVTALGSGDRAAVRSIAHGLSGSGGTFGFPEVSAAAETVELLAEPEGAEERLLEAGHALLDALAAVGRG